MTGLHREGFERADLGYGVSTMTGLDQVALVRGAEAQKALTDAALWEEINQNRRAERWLVPAALFALALVAVLVVIRQLYFR